MTYGYARKKIYRNFTIITCIAEYSYTNWIPVQPHFWPYSSRYMDSCVNYYSSFGFQWNDYVCIDTMFPICQFDYIL